MAKKKDDDIGDLFDLKIFGLDMGNLIKNIGITDLSSLQDEKKVEELKSKIEKEKDSFKEKQEELQKKLGDKIKVDYNFKVSGLLGGKDGFKISNGKFFDNLDALSKNRSSFTPTRRKAKIYPGKNKGPIKPTHEILNEKSHIELITELPGVVEKQIKIVIKKDELTITAKGDKKEYFSKIKLPVKIVSKAVEKSFINGILRIKYKKLKTTK